MVRKFSPRRGANIVSVGSGQDCRGVGTPIRGVGAGLPWGANEFQRQLLLCELQRPSSIPATSVASGQDFHCCGAGLPLGSGARLPLGRGRTSAGSGQDFRRVGAPKIPFRATNNSPENNPQSSNPQLLKRKLFWGSRVRNNPQSPKMIFVFHNRPFPKMFGRIFYVETQCMQSFLRFCRSSSFCLGSEKQSALQKVDLTN